LKAYPNGPKKRVLNDMVKCAQLYTGWLDNVSSIRKAHFSLLLSSYWSAGFGPFLQAPIIASHWLEDFQTVRQWQRKVTNVAPPAFSEALEASQKKSTFVIG
jgi:hypothetical protein